MQIILYLCIINFKKTKIKINVTKELKIILIIFFKRLTSANISIKINMDEWMLKLKFILLMTEIQPTKHKL